MAYKDIKAELFHGHRKIANNTHLRCTEDLDGECIRMSLHGNEVAVFRPRYFQLFTKGWFTHTTLSRLNLALSLAGVSYIKGQVRKVYQVAWQWFYGNYKRTDTKFYDGIRIGYTGRVLQ